MSGELSEYESALPPGVSNMGEERPTPGFFHYTTYGGLLGILESESIWATNIHYLNDYTEFSHAIEIATGALLGRKMRRLPGAILSDCCSALEKIENINIYVACFSENGDLLSQWRGYSAAGGVSIGFRYADLLRSAKRQDFHILKCIYDPEIKMRYIERIIDEAFADGKDPQLACDRFLKKFFQFAPAFKDEAFAEEREWRLISGVTSISHPQISFRPSSASLIPYYSFNLNDHTSDDSPQRRRLGIGQLIVGPGRQIIDLNPVTQLLIRRNIEWNCVMPSRIPYRSGH